MSQYDTDPWRLLHIDLTLNKNDLLSLLTSENIDQLSHNITISVSIKKNKSSCLQVLKENIV